jgi:hypothetical protein
MTLPDRSPPRKPATPRRLGLHAPFAALGVGIVLWSLAWLWMTGEIGRHMDAARDRRGGGYELSWKSRNIHGYPFRLDVDLKDARVREPSGWALAAPQVKAEAFVFSPDHWVAVAPAGAQFTRPVGGVVSVGAKVLRASLSEAADHPPRLSVEGIGLTFITPPGTNPFFLTSAEAFHLHTRAGPDEQGALYVEIDKAQARLSGLMARIAAGKLVNITADATYSHARAFSGADWPSAVRRWSLAGGELQIRQIHLAAGEAVLDARAGALTVGPDGRLRGALAASLRQAPRALAVMGQDGAISPDAAATAASVVVARAAGPVASVALDFQAGQTTLGPVSIGAAPRVY